MVCGPVAVFAVLLGVGVLAFRRNAVPRARATAGDGREAAVQSDVRSMRAAKASRTRCRPNA